MGENVLKWTLIHCSRRCVCVCDCVHFIFLFFLCVLRPSVWWCRLLKFTLVLFFFYSVLLQPPCLLRRRVWSCCVREQGVRTNGLIYCVPLDCLLSIQSLSLHCKSLALPSHILSLSFSTSSKWSFVLVQTIFFLYFCCAFFFCCCVEKCVKTFDNLNNGTGLPPMAGCVILLATACLNHCSKSQSILCDNRNKFNNTTTITIKTHILSGIQSILFLIIQCRTSVDKYVCFAYSAFLYAAFSLSPVFLRFKFCLRKST